MLRQDALDVGRRCAQDLMHLCPESVVGEWTEFLPHPGLAPGDTDLIDEYIAEAKLLDMADRVPAQRIM
jgi:hypothetical protein